MCLIAVHLRAHADVPCVVLANRDEFHNRASTPLDWWPDAPDLLGGRDQVAGGTWLALRRDGRFAAVTNFREPDARPAPRSRGELPARWLQEAGDPDSFEADCIAAAGATHGGFNLLYGVLPGGPERPHLRLASNRWSPGRRLSTGTHAVSNGHPDAPWPKVARGAALLEDCVARLERGQVPPAQWGEPLADAFADREIPDPVTLPDTGVGADLERFLGPVFIRGEGYGTRCTTAVIATASGAIHVHERRYDPDGGAIGETAIHVDRAV